MSRIKDPKKISAVVGDMYQKLGLTEAYNQYRTLQIWNEVVGETISAATLIERFTNGELYIRVKNPAWRMELNFRKKDILFKLNAALPTSMVREIVFK